MPKSLTGADLEFLSPKELFPLQGDDANLDGNGSVRERCAARHAQDNIVMDHIGRFCSCSLVGTGGVYRVSPIETGNCPGKTESPPLARIT
jgi:hypothetical protein